MAILSSSDYPAIRQALDITLDATALPDATIALPIYLGAAELEVKRRDPLAETRTGDDLQHIKNAAVLLTAAYLAPAIPQMDSMSLGAFSYAGSDQWQEKAAQLLARAELEIQALATQTSPTRPTMFAAATGRRGQ